MQPAFLIKNRAGGAVVERAPAVGVAAVAMAGVRGVGRILDFGFLILDWARLRRIWERRVSTRRIGRRFAPSAERNLGAPRGGRVSVAGVVVRVAGVGMAAVRVAGVVVAVVVAVGRARGDEYKGEGGEEQADRI